MSDELQPERPVEEGIAPDEPGTDRQEGVHLLANDARERLQDEGFTDQQIFEWAAAYTETVGTGTVDGLISYIRDQEH